MRDKLEANNKLWMGGTKIAESLATFNQRFANKALTDKTIVLIISDGFDTDDPAQLQAELQSIRAKAKMILWLNPMLGRKGVTITESQLHHQQPMVDKFISANNLEGLQKATRLIISAVN